MLEVKIKAAGRRYVAPEGLRAALGAQRAREKLADAIEALLLQMDLIDGDPDFEEDDLEDSFLLSDRARGIAAKCPAHDVEQDQGSWTEWHTRGRHKNSLGNVTANGHILHEDAEDDDAAEEDDHSGQCTEDEISTGLGHWGYGTGLSNSPGCEISDPGEREEEVCPTYGEDQTKLPTGAHATDEAKTMRATLDKIRSERCGKTTSRFGAPFYPLANQRARNIGAFPANAN